MAVTNQQIIDYLLANPNLSDAQIVSAMEQNGISPEQMASAVNIPVNQIVSRMAPVLAENVAQYGTQTQTLARDETGSTEISQRTLPGGFNAYQDESGQLSFSRVSPDRPGMIQLYGPNGEYRGEEKITTTTQDLIKNLGPIALAAGGTALAQGLMGSSLFSGGASAGSVLGTAGTAGMSAAELAQLDLALGGAGGTAGATSLGNALATGANVGTLTNLTGGSNSGLFSNVGSTLGNIGSTIGTTLGTAGTDLITKVGTGIGTNLLTGVGTKLAGDAITGGLGLTGGVLQQQQSREAAQTAAQNVDKATQQAVEASQFRPVGMTTRFGTSNYTYDPVTGRMTSAGYQLSPEAKAAQDRLVALAGQGLTQAEQAQSQFAPLQTAAQNLYSLGSQYIAKSPEEAAQDYINKQMQLLAPSREVDLANLQNRLFQQGRTGVSVAQGGTLGATTPELQALYNARAMQDLQLASQAQQEGRANTLFGSNLYDLGTAKLSNYYGGQTQAYAPYTTALGQVQNLETAAQQPLQIGAQLGQTAATAGANAGRIGLTGAQISGNLMTSPAVTNNPYAAFLSGLGSPTSTLGQGLANYITGYNPIADQNAVLNPYFTPTSVWNG